MCSGKVKRRKGVFKAGRRSGGGGVVLEQNGVLNALTLDLVLVDYLDKKMTLMMKLDQVLG